MTQAILKRSEVTKLVGLGYTTIWRLEKAGKFPARKQLSAMRVGWLRSEVEAWINECSCVTGSIQQTKDIQA